MNGSNRFGVESMARERQAEIEKQLRQAAELRRAQPSHTRPQAHIKWVAIGATTVSLIATIASGVIVHVR